VLDHLRFLAQFHHPAVWQNTAKVYTGIDHAVASDDCAWIDHRIATDLCADDDDRAEFSKTGGNLTVRRDYGDFVVIESYVERMTPAPRCA
jgi:hypothetical protein